MAKRGRKPKKKVGRPAKQLQTKKNLYEKLRQPEMWIGVFVVGIILGVLGGYMWKQSGYKITISKAVISPVPTGTAANTECSPAKKNEVMVTPSPVVNKNNQPSGPLDVTVLANESYWQIAQRICGDAKSNFLYIAELNGNTELFPGMTVKVVCQ